MFDYILAPLDGSKLSQSVIPYSVQIAKALHVPIVLLHVIESLPVYAQEGEQALDTAPERYGQEYRQAIDSTLTSGRAEHIRYLDLIIGREKAIAQRYLSLFANPIEAQNVKVESVVEIGKPAQEILRFAGQRRNGLIALSTHGRSGLVRLAMGSVADRLAHASSVPVLLIRPKEDEDEGKAIGSIVAPLDGSALSEGIMPAVQQLAMSLHIPVHLVRSVPISSEIWAGGETHSYVPAYLTSEVQTKVHADALRYLERMKATLEAEKIIADLSVLVGPADSRIVDYASEADDALIIMASHGRTGFNRWFLGSIAEKVIRSSGRPVLLVRPREE